MTKNLILAMIIAVSVSFSGLAQTTPSGNKKEGKKTEKRDSTYRKKGPVQSPTHPQDSTRKDTTGRK